MAVSALALDAALDHPCLQKLTMQTRYTMHTLRIERALFVLWGVSVAGEQLRAIAVLRQEPGGEIIPSEGADRGPPW